MEIYHALYSHASGSVKLCLGTVVLCIITKHKLQLTMMRMSFALQITHNSKCWTN